MTSKVKPIYYKDHENKRTPSIMVLISEDEVDDIIDAIDDSLAYLDHSEEDRAIYQGLRKRWQHHGKDLRRALRAAGLPHRPPPANES